MTELHRDHFPKVIVWLSDLDGSVAVPTAHYRMHIPPPPTILITPSDGSLVIFLATRNDPN